MTATMIVGIAFIVCVVAGLVICVGAGLVLVALCDRPSNGHRRTRTPTAAAEFNPYATKAHAYLIDCDAA